MLSNFGFYKTEVGEVNKIYSGLIEKIESGISVAVLVNINRSANMIINKLEENNIPYFNGLFKDTDLTYQRFHSVALEKFVNASGTGKSVSKRVMDKVIYDMEAEQESIVSDSVIFNSLKRLLVALFENVKSSSLSSDEKYLKIIFVLSNGSLKKLMND